MEKKFNINELMNELKEKVSDDAKRGTISINYSENDFMNNKRVEEVKESFSEKDKWKIEESKETVSTNDQVKRKVTIFKSQLHGDDEITEKYYNEDNKLVKKICGDHCEKYEYNQNGTISKSIFTKNGKSTLTYYNQFGLPVKQLFCGNSSVVRAKDYNTVFSAEYNQKGYMTNLVKDNGSISKEYSYMGGNVISYKSIFKNKNDEVIGLEVTSLNDHGHLSKVISNGKTIREFEYEYNVPYRTLNIPVSYAFLDLGNKTIEYKKETKRFDLNEYNAEDSNTFCYEESMHKYIIKQCGKPSRVINVKSVCKFINGHNFFPVSTTYDSGIVCEDSKMYKIDNKGKLEKIFSREYDDSTRTVTKSYLLNNKLIKRERESISNELYDETEMFSFCKYSIYEEFGNPEDIELYDNYFDDLNTVKEIYELIEKEAYHHLKMINCELI